MPNAGKNAPPQAYRSPLEQTWYAKDKDHVIEFPAWCRSFLGPPNADDQTYFLSALAANTINCHWARSLAGTKTPSAWRGGGP